MNKEVTQPQILRDFFRLLRRQWWLIIAVVLVAVGAAVAYSTQKEPTYLASSELQFNDISKDLNTLAIPTAAQPEPAKLAASEAEVITSDRVVKRVAKTVDTDLTRDEIRASVETAVDPDSNLVDLQTTAGDADLAAELANAFALQTRNVVTVTERGRLLVIANRLEESVEDEKKKDPIRNQTLATANQLRTLAEVIRPVTVASYATAPGSPESPKPVRDTILALLLGVIFGILAGFLRDSLDRRLTDPHEVQHQLHIPMLGYVLKDSLGGVGLSQNGAKKSSDEGIEQFRILRSNVEFLAPDRTVKIVAITSPLPEEGKSTVAAGLATAGVLAGKRVLLVECDLRRPVLAERFKLQSQPGLTDWVAGNAKPAEVIQQVPIERRVGQVNGRPAPDTNVGSFASALSVIVSGSWSPMPAELLGSERFGQFLGQVGKVYDQVVLDCAPLLPVGDTLEVLPRVDATLICIRLDRTTREQALAAKTAVEHLPPHPTGLVVTGARKGREGYYYGYYSSLVSHPQVVTQPSSQGSPSGVSR